jgi:hypothetical protein
MHYSLKKQWKVFFLGFHSFSVNFQVFLFAIANPKTGQIWIVFFSHFLGYCLLISFVVINIKLMSSAFIQFDKPFYFAGDTIEGHVFLYLSEPVNARDLIVKFKGW